MRLYLDGAGHEETLFEVTSSGGSTQTNWQTVHRDVSNFRNETVELRVQIQGGGELQLEYFYVRRNHDGDRFWDNTEREGIPTGSGGAINTNPYESDSDFDGIPDGKEMGTLVNYGNRYWIVDTNPLRGDTDGDYLRDKEETSGFKSAATASDTDYDGYPDFVDPNIITEDNPPQFLNVTSTDFGKYVDIYVTDGAEIQNVSARALYEGSQGGTNWYGSKHHRIVKTGETYYGERYRIDFAYYQGDPVKYTINITDSRDTTASILVVPTGDSANAEFSEAWYNVTSNQANTLAGVTASTVVVSTGVETGGAAGSLAVAVESVAAPAVLAYLALTSAQIGGDFYTGVTTSESVEYSVQGLASVPATATLVTYPKGETPNGVGKIRLPRGATIPGTVGDGHERGFGWEYIKKTPGIHEENDIGEVLRAPSPEVVTNEDYTIIIGDNPSGKGKLIIYTSAGIIVRASVYEIIEDSTNREVIIDRSNRHPVRGGDHPSSYDPIRETIRNPDEIWERSNGQSALGSSRFFIKYINGEWLVVRTYCRHLNLPFFSGYGCTISTAVYEGTKQEVRDLLRRKGFDIPGDRVH